MRSKLYGYQQEIVDSRKVPQIALFMSMGCGKTITSLACYEKFKTPKILVVCMVSKLRDWQNDLRDEVEITSVILDKGSKKNGQLIKEGGNAFVINFESCWRCPELTEWIDKDTTIIVDESHKMKSPKSSVGKWFHELKKKTEHKIILTGTPQSQGYIDYYNQLYFIDLLGMTFRAFQQSFCVYDKRMFNGYPVNTLVGYKNTNLLDTCIKNNCVFYERKLDEELLPVDIVQYFDKPKMYDKFKRDRVYKDVIADSSGKLFVTMRTLCSGNIENYEVDNQKLQWLDDFLDCTDDRVVVFYNFNVERDRIINMLKRKKIVYNEYNGREKRYDEFKKYERSVILCHYRSASLGINDLVVSKTCVLYSLPLDYTDYIQSKKRIDRIGQTRKPLFYTLLCRGTLEEKILDKLQKGQNFDGRMFDLYMTGTLGQDEEE